MAARDLVCTWRRPLVFLARGLCVCSLALLYLFISLALCFGRRTARTAQPSPSSIAEENSSTIPETTPVGFDAPLNTHHPLFSSGQSLVSNAQNGAGPLVVPRIVVQDYSAEDGSIRSKVPEYDLMDSLKRRRRFPRARASVILEDHLAFMARPPPFRPPPSLGAPSVGRPRPLYFTESIERGPSSVAGFTGRKGMFEDVVAKDGSFVIVGL